jgi:hypothetical protein
MSIFLLFRINDISSNPLNQQKSRCAAKGITLLNYTKVPENAVEAHTYVGVSFLSKTFYPCKLNSALVSTGAQCLIGEDDGVRLEVSDNACNLVDVK